MARKNQKGIVSIMVASIIMVIVSLITLGFARIMQREQRQALDRQLSTQAFYAAESGINDAIDRLQSVTNGDYSALEKNSCDVSNWPSAGANGAIDNPSDVRYTCLIINPYPPTLEYNNGVIAPGNAHRVARVSPVGATPVGMIRISWDTPNATNFGACSIANPYVADWPADRPAMLRIDLISTRVLNRNALQANVMNLYVYPGSGGGCQTFVTYAANSDAVKGLPVAVNCNTANVPRDCRIDIRGLTDTTDYYVRIGSFYREANVTIEPFTDATATTPVRMKGAQAIIDSTGKSNDVLRRIQVRVPLVDDTAMTDSVFSSTESMCKLLSLSRDASNNIVVRDDC